MKQIVIIDEHPLFREGLKSIVRSYERFEVVGDSGDVNEAFRICKEQKPDLVTMELTLKHHDSIQLLRDIRLFLPNTSVMIISMSYEIDHIIRSFRAGAAGYIVKGSGYDSVLKGFDAVLNGEYFLDSPLSLKMLRKYIETPLTGNGISRGNNQFLTSRELEILSLQAMGDSNKTIGKKLFISCKTVGNHIANIMNKLSVHSNFEMIRYASKLGLVDVDHWKENMPDIVSERKFLSDTVLNV